MSGMQARQSARLATLPASHFLNTGDTGVRLAGGRCAACGAVHFPAPSVCPRCLSTEMVKQVLSPFGKLYSYTVVHVGRATEDGPVAVGYVDLPEGVRIYSALSTSEGLAPDRDMVLAVYQVDGEGSGESGYAFEFSPRTVEGNNA